MDPTPSIDTASVRALLDSLRASTAWQQTIASEVSSSHSSTPHADTATPPGDIPAVPTPSAADNAAPPTDPAPPVSVASLLSQLQATANLAPSGIPSDIVHDTQAPQFSSRHLDAYSDPPAHVSRTSTLAPSPPGTLDLRKCTFQQALPHIARLSEDRAFVEAVRTMKQEQAQLEKRLWEERQSIEKRHEEKVHVARTKANMIGVGLTQYEADTMTDSFRRELQKFDKERVLPAWDGLIARQQATLESLGVPAMYPTTAAEDRKRQQKIMQVLAGFAE